MTTKITEKNISNIANRFIQWQSVITADGSTATSAVAGQGYLIDTTSATHTITLPSSPSIGDSIAIKDYAGTFATNNLTIGRNGSNIQGAANDSLISSNRASLTLVYVDSTRGWVYSKESNVGNLGAPLFITATGGTITTSGNFKIHSFTGDGCFVVSQIGNAPSNPTGGPANVDYIVVAGGGGGGSSNSGGGGGAGGYRTTFPSPGCNAGAFPISATTYPITVGGGGTPGSSSDSPGSPAQGGNGSNSVFSTITSTGGGGGAGYAAPGTGTSGNNTWTGNNGGSGGGGSNCGLGGSGNTPPVSPSQGNPGNPTGYPSSNKGGGGGGATASGGNAPPGGPAGPGGAGAPNSITGSATTYAGGGGGGIATPAPGSNGSGGAGGGGAGGDEGNGVSGTANTGGGGGGSGRQCGVSNHNGGAGGKGIVIIRYKYQ